MIYLGGNLRGNLQFESLPLCGEAPHSPLQISLKFLLEREKEFYIRDYLLDIERMQILCKNTENNVDGMPICILIFLIM